MNRDLIKDLDKRHMFMDMKCMLRFVQHSDTYFDVGLDTTIIAKATMNGEYATKFIQDRDKCKSYKHAVNCVNKQLMK